MRSLSDSISSSKGCRACCNSGLNPSASSRFTFRGLQPRSRSPYDLVKPRAVLISDVRARTSPARARMTVRSACAFRLRCCTGPSSSGSMPAGPASGHRSDHLCGGSPRSNAPGAHAPQSLPAPVHSTTIRLDTDLYTIIGVMPPDFRHPGRTLGHDVEVWVAAGYAAAPFPKPPVRTQRVIFGAIARLKPGLFLAQAQAKLDAFAAHLREQYPTDYLATAQWRARLVPLQQEVVGNASSMLFLLLASVGVVLTIACVNIASLLLARSSSRHREIAVRQALGASSWRLVRQTLTESVVLSLCGGALAVPVSFLLKDILLTLVPSTLPRLTEVVLNGRALLFVFAISVITGLLFGLAPAVQMSHRRLMDKLSLGSRCVGIASRQPRFLSALVACEFALSLVLMVGAGLLLRSFWKVLEVQPGFNSDHLVTAQLWLPVPNDPKNNPYPTQEKLNVFVSEVLRRVSALPGVNEVAIGGGNTLFTGGRNATGCRI